MLRQVPAQVWARTGPVEAVWDGGSLGLRVAIDALARLRVLTSSSVAALVPCSKHRHGAAGPQPSKVIKLFGGSTFDAQYNARRPTLRFRTPNGTERALLEAVITGASCSK